MSLETLVYKWIINVKSASVNLDTHTQTDRMVVHPCIQCEASVTGRSHAIACDECGRWNHRKCGTGISHQQYQQIQQGDLTIDWRCEVCLGPTEEDESAHERSRHNSTAMEDQIPPPLILDVSPMRQDRRGDIPDVTTVDDQILPMELDVSQDRQGVFPDITFNLTRGEFQGPTAPLEESMEDRPLTADILEDEPVTFEVVESGTKRGGAKLLASDGYTYTRGVSYTYILT